MMNLKKSKRIEIQKNNYSVMKENTWLRNIETTLNI
jgi:hypothetical protein